MTGQQIGITTTVPVEVILAAGLVPVDLNNRFILAPERVGLLAEAEELGLPRTLCAWIKGMYAWTLAHPEPERVIAVTQGDCSNTHVLMELWALEGRQSVPFAYPLDADRAKLAAEIADLSVALGADLAEAEAWRQRLLPLRTDLVALDELTWRDRKVNGLENEIWLVSASDFDGDPVTFQDRLTDFLAEARRREPLPCRARLGVLGVPPIMDGLYETLQDLGGCVLYNEVPRQFAMPPDDTGWPTDLVEQYAHFTYPYSIFHRLTDIRREVQRRQLDGLVHYTQSFCHRQAQDVILRRELKMPILTLEGDRPGPLDARTKMRLEAFVDLVRG